MAELDDYATVTLSSRAAAVRAPGNGVSRQFTTSLSNYRRHSVNQRGNQAGPPGLVGSAQTGPIIAVKKLVEQDEVPPVQIFLEFPSSFVNRPSPFPISGEDPNRTVG